MAILRPVSLIAVSSLLLAGAHAQQASSPNTCTGRTLNVLSASLDWWYPQTYTTIASTFIVQYDPTNHSPTGWTLVSAAASKTFDASSAVNSPSCTTFTLTEDGASEAFQVCNSTPAPLAASTTVLTQTAYDTGFTATTGTGTVPYIATAPAGAAITIPSSGGAYAAGTAFVFFSAYEILTQYALPTASLANGVVQEGGCATATSTYSMATPFSFEYAGNGSDVNGLELVNADVTGDVAPAFLSVVNATGAGVVAGSWVAAPTVVVVAEKVIGVLSSQSSLQTPSPTLVGGLSSYVLTLTSGSTGAKTTVVPGTAASVLVTALELQLPTYTTATTSSSSVYTGSPTNALEVLTAALGQFPSSTSSSLVLASTSSLIADAAASSKSVTGVTRLAETQSALQGQPTTSSKAGGVRRRTIAGTTDGWWSVDWSLGLGTFFAAGGLALAVML